MATMDAAALPPVAGLEFLSADQRSVLATVKTSSEARGHGMFVNGPEQQAAIFEADTQFVKHADERFPAVAVPNFRYDDPRTGAARLGIAMATLSQLLYVVDAGRLPDMHAFAELAIARVRQVRPSTATDMFAQTYLAGLAATAMRALPVSAAR